MVLSRELGFGWRVCRIVVRILNGRGPIVLCSRVANGRGTVWVSHRGVGGAGRRRICSTRCATARAGVGTGACFRSPGVSSRAGRLIWAIGGGLNVLRGTPRAAESATSCPPSRRTLRHLCVLKSLFCLYPLVVSGISHCLILLVNLLQALKLGLIELGRIPTRSLCNGRLVCPLTNNVPEGLG